MKSTDSDQVRTIVRSPASTATSIEGFWISSACSLSGGYSGVMYRGLMAVDAAIRLPDLLLDYDVTTRFHRDVVEIEIAARQSVHGKDSTSTVTT